VVSWFKLPPKPVTREGGNIVEKTIMLTIAAGLSVIFVITMWPYIWGVFVALAVMAIVNLFSRESTI